MQDITSPYDHRKIKELVESQGRMKSWVADQLGITPSHFSRMIMGERPITRRNAARLAEILGVSIKTLERDEVAA